MPSEGVNLRKSDECDGEANDQPPVVQAFNPAHCVDGAETRRLLVVGEAPGMQLLSGVDISAKHSHEENSSGDETNGRCSRVGLVCVCFSLFVVCCFFGWCWLCVL